MNLSKITLATSLALAVMSAHAADQTPAALPAAITSVAADHKFFISGASGFDNYLLKLIPTYLDQTDNAYKLIYSEDKVDTAWYGKLLSNNFGLSAGEYVLIHKRSTGGSAFGIGPVAKGTTIGVLDLSVNATQKGSATSKEYTVPGLTTDANGLVPQIGLSDVEPKMFLYPLNQEYNATAVTAADINQLAVAPLMVLAEGIAVTNTVSESTVLSKNFIRAALQGSVGYQTWAKADGSTDKMIICRRVEGSGTQAAFNSYFNGYPDTQTFNGYAKTQPAIVSSSVFTYNVLKNAAEQTLYGSTTTRGTGASNDPIIVNPASGYVVAEGDSSTDVRKCLQAAQLKEDVTLKGRGGLYYRYRFSAGSGKAIGVLSLDSYTKASTATAATRQTKIDGNGYARSTGDTFGEWTFRNLGGAGTYDVANQVATCATGTDTTINSKTVSFSGGCTPAANAGIAPSRMNILNSSYDFVVEPTIQYKTGLAAGAKLFFDKLLADISAPVDLMASSSKNKTPFAFGALPTATSVKSTTPYSYYWTETSDQMYTDLTRQGVTPAPLHVFKQ